MLGKGPAKINTFSFLPCLLAGYLFPVGLRYFFVRALVHCDDTVVLIMFLWKGSGSTGWLLLGIGCLLFSLFSVCLFVGFFPHCLDCALLNDLWVAFSEMFLLFFVYVYLLL